VRCGKGPEGLITPAVQNERKAWFKNSHLC